MYWGVSYILYYTYNLHHNFCRAPTVEKFNPQLVFHNSNNGLATPPPESRELSRRRSWRQLDVYQCSMQIRSRVLDSYRRALLTTRCRSRSTGVACQPSSYGKLPSRHSTLHSVIHPLSAAASSHIMESSLKLARRRPPSPLSLSLSLAVSAFHRRWRHRCPWQRRLSSRFLISVSARPCALRTRIAVHSRSAGRTFLHCVRKK